MSYLRKNNCYLTEIEVDIWMVLDVNHRHDKTK